MPEIIVCPVSSSVFTRKVGSSSTNLVIANPIFSWSSFVFGSIAIEITGLGKLIDSKIIGSFRSQRVSPVVVFFIPTMAAISPAETSSISFL